MKISIQRNNKTINLKVEIKKQDIATIVNKNKKIYREPNTRIENLMNLLEVQRIIIRQVNKEMKCN